MTGADELPGKSTYFIGNDPKKWHSNVTNYAQVKYEGIYSGIDLVYYGNQRQLEYDFVVAPGADPHRIQFDVRGAKSINRELHGELVLRMEGGEIRWRKPIAYQGRNQAMLQVACEVAFVELVQIEISQVVVGHLPGEHVRDGHQNFVGDSDRRSLVAAPGFAKSVP